MNIDTVSVIESTEGTFSMILPTQIMSFRHTSVVASQMAVASLAATVSWSIYENSILQSKKKFCWVTGKYQVAKTQLSFSKGASNVGEVWERWQGFLWIWGMWKIEFWSFWMEGQAFEKKSLFCTIRSYMLAFKRPKN